jgi:hypothetical protein
MADDPDTTDESEQLITNAISAFTEMVGIARHPSPGPEQVDAYAAARALFWTDCNRLAGWFPHRSPEVWRADIVGQWLRTNAITKGRLLEIYMEFQAAPSTFAPELAAPVGQVNEGLLVRSVWRFTEALIWCLVADEYDGSPAEPDWRRAQMTEHYFSVATYGWKDHFPPPYADTHRPIAAWEMMLMHVTLGGSRHD